ncbi:hypothetical protein FACS189418_0170 [Clostridia bacterium]|nr:hypothetical protein FACS189418_0170 [Clostridia bacterium]
MCISGIQYQQLDEYIQAGDRRIIDLRTKQAYDRCHIETAENIPFEQLSVYSFQKNEKIIFYCDRGNSSLMACRNFNRQGFDTMTVMGAFASYRGKYLWRRSYS